jgi:predicted O-methyltransferase YrrM
MSAWSTLIAAMRSTNLNGVILAVKDRRLAREYLSQSIVRYDELAGRGLRPRNPVHYVQEQGWADPMPDLRVEMPLDLDTPGGTRLDELLVLAAVTRALHPSRVFEIGTFHGRATSVFVMNSAPGARIYSLHLPPVADLAASSRYLSTDIDLVKERRIGSFLHELQLANRYEQIFADSLEFDPAPYCGAIELGFIDGAHALRYVKNDSEKMAEMMAERGLVFWHDYGGKGSFGELTSYLDGLARKIAIYRVANTTLAWAPASELRKIL